MISILNTLYSAVVRKGAAFSAAINNLFAILEARSTYFENEKASKTNAKELEDAGLLGKASIVLTPTGYSKDAIHNVKPSASPFGDMTLIQNGTSTRVNENGLVVDNTTDIPRIDYSKGSGAILSEIGTTNQVRYSEDFSNSLWIKSAINMTSSTKTNPRGINQTIYNITGVPAPGNGLSAAFASYPSGQATGVSIWIKRTSGAGNTGNVWIGSGNFSSGTGDLIAVGNEWQRISYAAPQYGGANIYIQPEYGHYFDIWGAQGEYGLVSGGTARITSYIPTTSSSATRARDNYLNGGDTSLIGAQEGVLFFEGAAIANQVGRTRGVGLSASNSAANRVVLFFSSSSNSIQGLVQASASTVIAIYGTVADQTAFNKIAIKYKSGDIALWINGTEAATSTASFTFNGTLSELALDQGNGSQHMDGHVKQLVVFKEILSDAELAALTS